MRLTTIAHYVLPFVALISGASILLIPRLLNYVVAAYLVLVGLIGLNGIFHLVR
jgi:cobalamin synthase